MCPKASFPSLMFLLFPYYWRHSCKLCPCVARWRLAVPGRCFRLWSAEKRKFLSTGAPAGVLGSYFTGPNSMSSRTWSRRQGEGWSCTWTGWVKQTLAGSTVVRESWLSPLMASAANVPPVLNSCVSSMLGLVCKHKDHRVGWRRFLVSSRSY